MRIASLAPSCTIMLQELGVAERIVACTHICPLPKPTRQALAVGSFSVLNEKLLGASSPDLVITATLVQAKGAERLRKAGYRVLHFDPGTVEGIADTYEMLGQEVGREEMAASIAARMRSEIAAWQARALLEGSAHPRVYMEEWAEPPFVAGNWVPDMVRLAGGEPVLTRAGQPSRSITLHELLVSDPDVIAQHVCLPPLLPERTVRDVDGRWQQRRVLKARLLARSGWENLRAVQRGSVFSLDDSLFNMPVQSALSGIECLHSLLRREV